VWGRDPRECVVIDDAPHGVTAARTAGMEAVLVHRFSYSPSVAADDVVVGSLDALELDHRLAVTTHA
jgi:beta-phosphoglucomutase-like phosphatase (HAD superfamily)